MRKKKFKLYELVTPYHYWILMDKGGVEAIIVDGIIIETWVSPAVWSLFNMDFIRSIQRIRIYLKKSVHVNNWHMNQNILNLIKNDYKEDLFEISIKGSTDDKTFITRGLTPLEIETGEELSPQMFGVGIRFTITDYSTDQVREYLIEHQKMYPEIHWIGGDELEIWADGVDRKKKEMILSVTK